MDGDALYIPASVAREHADRRALAYLSEAVEVCGRLWRPVTLRTWQALATEGNLALHAPELAEDDWQALTKAEAWRFLWLHFPYRKFQMRCPNFVALWLCLWGKREGWDAVRKAVFETVRVQFADRIVCTGGTQSVTDTAMCADLVVDMLAHGYNRSEVMDGLSVAQLWQERRAIARSKYNLHYEGPEQATINKALEALEVKWNAELTKEEE